MNWKRQLAKVRNLFTRAQRGADLEEEIRSHLRMEEQENLESGMSPEEAHYRALRRFGNVTLTQERSREMWGWNSMETLWQDFCYGIRQLRRSPGFTTVAILTLALGIGANTAIFSVIDAVLLRQLPVRSPQALIQLATVGPYGVGSFSYPGFKRFRDENHVCSEMAAIGWLNKLDATIDGQAETVEGRIVSGNFFSFLGVGAIVGRTFTPEDEKAAHSSAVAVISYGYWKRRFGLDPSVVGRSVTLNRTVFTVVGVAPVGFSGPEIGYSPDIYVPVVMEPAFRDGKSWLGQPDLRIGGFMTLEEHVEHSLGHERLMATLSSFFAGLAVLLACVGLYGVMAYTVARRTNEIGIRMALGAGRRQVFGMILGESALLVAAGVAAGLPVAIAATRLISGQLYGLKPADPATIAGAILLLTAVAALAGYIPARRATKVDPLVALRYE